MEIANFLRDTLVIAAISFSLAIIMYVVAYCLSRIFNFKIRNPLPVILIFASSFFALFMINKVSKMLGFSSQGTNLIIFFVILAINVVMIIYYFFFCQQQDKNNFVLWGAVLAGITIQAFINFLRASGVVQEKILSLLSIVGIVFFVIISLTLYQNRKLSK